MSDHRLPNLTKLGCWGIPLLVSAPMVVMILLTVNVLWPTLHDPQSRIYGSSIGYPAIQRRLGHPIAVEAVVVGANALDESLAAPGQSIAAQEIDVRPEISGRVEAVLVKAGDRVRQGQPLLRLETTNGEAVVAQAQQNLLRSQAQLRTLQVETAGLVQQLETEILVARRRLQDADHRLNENDRFVARQIERDVRAAQARLESARDRLNSIRRLYDQGAVSLFQVQDAQDAYTQRQQEYDAAEQGVFFDQNHRFINRDFYLERQQSLHLLEQQLTLLRRTKALEIQDAALAVAQDQLRLEDAERNLSRTVLSASVEGLISTVDVDAGDFYDLDDRRALMTLSRDVVFEAYVDQARLNAVQPGDPAIIRLVSYPGQIFQGTVTVVNPVVETEGFRLGKTDISNQYTYSVQIRIDNLEMPPGLQGFVQFSQDKQALIVPESAVTHLSGGEGMVMVIEASQARVRRVQLGYRYDNQREIIAGLSAGERVILHPVPCNRAMW
jgi:HlyD family secretion protein